MITQVLCGDPKTYKFSIKKERPLCRAAAWDVLRVCTLLPAHAGTLAQLHTRKTGIITLKRGNLRLGLLALMRNGHLIVLITRQP